MPKTKPGWTTNKNQLDVTWRSPSDIIMYAKNSKLHPPEQIKQIAQSIVEFGFLDPIAIDENGEILEGHGRYLAAESLQLKSVPTVQILGLTQEQKVAYRIAHNKLTMNSDFDPDLLKLDMDFLSEMDFDLELTGFDSEDLSSYLEIDTTEYQAPERQENVVSSNQELQQEQSPLDDDITSLEDDSDNNYKEETDVIFPSTNNYGIPDLLPNIQPLGAILPVIGYGTRNRRDGMNKGTLHFYLEDYRFNAIWKNPETILQSGCKCIIEPNYSTNDQMPMICVLWTIFKKRWLNRFWQSKGIPTIVDLAIAGRYRDLALIGVPKGWRSYASHFYESHDSLNWLDANFEQACEHAESKNILFIVYGGNDKLGKIWQDKGYTWIKTNHITQIND